IAGEDAEKWGWRVSVAPRATSRESCPASAPRASASHPVEAPSTCAHCVVSAVTEGASRATEITCAKPLNRSLKLPAGTESTTAADVRARGEILPTGRQPPSPLLPSTIIGFQPDPAALHSSRDGCRARL